MSKVFLLSLVILFFYFSGKNTFLLANQDQSKYKDNAGSEQLNIEIQNIQPTIINIDEIKKMLKKQAVTLNSEVTEKILTVLQCGIKNNIEHNNVLTIIDYSLPSNEKRLWVIDLSKNILLFHTYVSHGIKSGTLLSNYFSNNWNSKSSSIGVFNTEKAYSGRHGPSLKLLGLDRGFNDNAYNRFIVMHGAWYVDEGFIKKYGRVGRSWGCPAVPDNLIEPIINTIKDKSLFVVYYPSNHWLLSSKFLNCNNPTVNFRIKNQNQNVTLINNEIREPIVFADINNNNKLEVNEPVIVVSANDYQKIFNLKSPLTRMLRRQLNNQEYIALSPTEVKKLDRHNDNIYFIIPDVRNVRGFYETRMKPISLGKIREIRFNYSASNHPSDMVTIDFENKPSVNIKSTNQFIRWIGL